MVLPWATARAGVRKNLNLNLNLKKKCDFTKSPKNNLIWNPLYWSLRPSPTMSFRTIPADPVNELCCNILINTAICVLIMTWIRTTLLLNLFTKIQFLYWSVLLYDREFYQCKGKLYIISYSELWTTVIFLMFLTTFITKVNSRWRKFKPPGRRDMNEEQPLELTSHSWFALLE